MRNDVTMRNFPDSRLITAVTRKGTGATGLENTLLLLFTSSECTWKRSPSIMTAKTWLSVTHDKAIFIGSHTKCQVLTTAIKARWNILRKQSERVGKNWKTIKVKYAACDF